jgi:heparin/heparan-sulfate lyase
VRDWWYPGHAFHQGPGYADARFHSDMYALWIFARMGAGNVFHPSQQFVPYEWIYLRRPDGKFVRSGDGQNWPTRMGSLLCASFYGDGYLLANSVDLVPDPNHRLFQFLWRDPDSKTVALSDNKLFELLWRDLDLKNRCRFPICLSPAIRDSLTAGWWRAPAGTSTASSPKCG